MKVANALAVKELEHFKDRVPQAVAEKIAKLAYIVHDDFISEAGEAYGCKNINEVSGVGYDGFIPFKDGGYEVTEFYANQYGDCANFTNAQAEWQGKQYDYMLENFASDNDLTLEQAKDYDSLSDDMKENLHDYESEWFEPALLRFEVWCNVSSQDDLSDVSQKHSHADSEAHYDNAANSVMMRLSLGYSDAPYYRSAKDDETFKEVTLSFDDFMAQDNEALIKSLFEGV